MPLYTCNLIFFQAYSANLYPILVPFLYPATNTFMTASIYMTVAVAVNR
jgi:hypothetical protein